MRSVEFGTRWSSVSSKLIFQLSPSFSTPRIFSGGRPVSSASCLAASRTSSAGFTRPFEDERPRVLLFVRSAILGSPFELELPAHLQADQQLVDACVVLLVGDFVSLESRVELGQL